MEYQKLGNYVSLRRGLAINAGNAHLVSGTKCEGFIYPLLRIADMISGKYEKYISNSVNKSVIAKPDDIIYTRTGRVGLVFLGYSGVVHNNSFIVSLQSNALSKDYLYAVLNSDFVRNQALAFAKNSAQPDLTHDMFKSIIIPVYSRKKQNEIAAIYNSLSKKIELNKRINGVLYQMAYEIYMHIFYGKKPNGKLGNAIIEHPRSNVQVSEAKEQTGIIPFFTSGDSIYRWTESFVSGENIFLNTGGNADVKFYVGEAAYSTDTWCISGKDGLSVYLYLMLKSLNPELNQKFFKGTGLKHLQKSLLKDRPIYLPTSDELVSFNANVQPWLSMISDNIRESEELTALRDWLLPIMMTGQATISN